MAVSANLTDVALNSCRQLYANKIKTNLNISNKMNHKRFLSIGTAMPLAACAVLMFGACSGKKSNDNSSASNSQTVFATDSI